METSFIPCGLIRGDVSSLFRQICRDLRLSTVNSAQVPSQKTTLPHKPYCYGPVHPPVLKCCLAYLSTAAPAKLASMV